MKLNKKVQTEIANNLRKDGMAAQKLFEQASVKIRNAKSIEEIMEIKQNLLYSSTYIIPLSVDTCYFCLDTSSECGSCKYGKVHGYCIDDGESDYYKISDAIGDLKQAIDNYYKGEIYTTFEAKRETVYCSSCNRKYRRIKKDNGYGSCKCGKLLL